MKKQILAILPALGVMVITWGAPRLLNYVHQLNTPSIVGPMVPYGVPDAQLPPPPDGMMPAPAGDSIPGNVPMPYPGDAKMSHPTTGSFPNLQINWVLIWVVVAIELGLFGRLIWAVTQHRSELPGHALFWVVSQAILSAFLSQSSVFDVMAHGILRPIGFCLIAISMAGTLVALSELIIRRHMLFGDDVVEVLMHFDNHTGTSLMLMYFWLIPMLNAGMYWILSIQVIFTIGVQIWVWLSSDALRTSLRRRVDPAAFDVLEQSIARLRISMSNHYPGRHVDMMANKEGDHIISSMSHLDGSISVSVAALQQLTDEEMLVLSAMQAVRPFSYRLLDIPNTMTFMLVGIAVIVSDGLSMFWLMLVLIPVLMSEYYRRNLAVAADRRAIDRLNMEKTAVAVLQKQIEGSTGEVRKGLLIRAGAIFKHGGIPLTE